MLSNKISKLIIRKVALFSITFLVVLSAIALASFTNILSGENTPTQSGALAVTRGQKVHTFVNMRKSDGRSLETPGDLSISGNIQIKGGSPSAGKFLKAIDTDGNTIWTNISAIQGAQGATGVGIAQTNIINGQLIITLTDGTVITGSSIIGPKGNTGAAGTPGTGALGATGATGVGIARTNIVNGQLIITLTNGTVITGTSITGPRGATGTSITGASITGAMGATGLSITGAMGATGLSITGARGATGFLDGGISAATPYYDLSKAKRITGSTNIYNNGLNIGIGDWGSSSIPEAGLHVKLDDSGITLRKNVLFGSSLNGGGNKFIWNNIKGALRAGTANLDRRDNANIGTNSIAFGYSTKVTSDYSSILGGMSNEINNQYGSYSFIGGGAFNINQGMSSFMGGGQYNNINGTDTMATTLVGGEYNNTHGSYGFIGGGQYNNFTGSNSVIVGGSNNTGGDSYTSIVGGKGNQAYGENSVIVGGFENITYEAEGSIVGGKNNKVESRGSTIVGGKTNRIRWPTSSQSFIGGGNGNTIEAGNGQDESDQASVIVGGKNNTTNGIGGFHFIGGGQYNQIAPATPTSNPGMDNEYSLIVGGLYNKVQFPYSSIVGGAYNEIIGWQGLGHSFIGGGFKNFIYAKYSSIVGGSGNRIDLDNLGTYSDHSFIGGGESNIIEKNNHSFIGGGRNNSILGTNGTYASIIGGEENNIVSSPYSLIGGGKYNQLKGSYSVILGGGGRFTTSGNILTGNNSTIVGGSRNTINGDYSFSAGTNTSNPYSYSFVRGDNLNIQTTSIGNHTFNVRAGSGTRFTTSEFQINGGNLRMASHNDILLNEGNNYNGLGRYQGFGGLDINQGIAIWGENGGILGKSFGSNEGILAWNADGIGIKTNPAAGYALTVPGWSSLGNVTIGGLLTSPNNAISAPKGINVKSSGTLACTSSTEGQISYFDGGSYQRHFFGCKKNGSTYIRVQLD